jgi:riboflavin kinase/FMN adenylyltransferase
MPPVEPRRNMHLIRYLPETSARARAVAIGNFDGLHLGHRAVIAAMARAAEANGLVPSALTFEPHPRRFFTPGAENFRIERLSDKLRGLVRAGVKDVVMPRFNAAFASMSPEQFLDKVLGQQLNAKAVVTGKNFAFGHKRGGTIQMLRAWGESQGVEIITVPPVRVGSDICSSSAVRAAIAAGDMTQAATLLGRSHQLRGRVRHGEKRGRTIGFPTANIVPAHGLLLPPYGVYAIRAEVNGTLYDGVANLGIRPTIGSYAQATLEAHLFDFCHEIYGSSISVSLCAFIRPEQTFEGLDALKVQIAKDCETAKTILGRHI